MKIVHTSDLHLTDDEKYQHRWDALKEIVEVFKKEQADILVIAGDLFDSVTDANKTYEKLRKILDEIQVIILPGNHDNEFYNIEGKHLGSNVTVITSIDAYLDFDNVRVLGLPYEEGLNTTEKVYEKLRYASSLKKTDKLNILLFHGELLSTSYTTADDFYEKGRYMPVELETLNSLGFSYILAGHFHTRYDVRNMENGYFIYPGSPVSISQKEKGKRKINIVKLGETPKPVELNSFHYIEKEVRLSIDDDPIERIDTTVQQTFQESQNSKFLLLLKVTGYFNGAKFSITEQMVNMHLNSLKRDYNIECQFDAKDIGNIIANDKLMRKIIEKINSKGLDEEKRYAIIKRLVDAFLEIK
ncbi:metallophosphoesterase family protein [Fervidobacterium gondwanense]|uniref:DNA repair exonuclease SbcCD nuclease subunit n=1 Tax=Fervidobacterium gondwanense DSM 13020 TaxID=1121883 RepID=A0A1M7SUQ5_FERGO|nr:DNA repair exonuclease [Fervidobacterium gondwanense]SHN62140.1 DNA repair exonuclease SbcCD nuclease subunit [Fervidobacterium gondwanense DSM 13020]